MRPSPPKRATSMAAAAGTSAGVDGGAVELAPHVGHEFGTLPVGAAAVVPEVVGVAFTAVHGGLAPVVVALDEANVGAGEPQCEPGSSTVGGVGVGAVEQQVGVQRDLAGP